MSRLTDYFPGLATSGFRVTSPHTASYNCIAWAAGDAERWWWPDAFGLYYWPSCAPRHETLEAFEAAYASLGFEGCEFDAFEEGFEKVALFADEKGKPTHASRQLPNGKWTSKCGKLEDIEHELKAIAGDTYGQAVRYLRRSLCEDR